MKGEKRVKDKNKFSGSEDNYVEESKESKSDQEKEEVKKNNKEKEDEKIDKTETLQRELKECKDRLLRTVAEYENFRKRSEKEKDAIYSDALSFVILGILPIADSLESALETFKGEDKEYRKGIELLKTQFDEALKKLGVEAFGKKGENFEPTIHNAISHIEEDSDEQNVISKVFQKGYKTESRIIRHAMVQVSN